MDLVIAVGIADVDRAIIRSSVQDVAVRRLSILGVLAAVNEDRIGKLITLGRFGKCVDHEHALRHC